MRMSRTDPHLSGGDAGLPGDLPLHALREIAAEAQHVQDYDRSLAFLAPQYQRSRGSRLANAGDFAFFAGRLMEARQLDSQRRTDISDAFASFKHNWSSRAESFVRQRLACPER